MNKIIFLFFSFLLSSNLLVAQQKVSIYTNVGEIIVVLYDETPKHKANFIKLVQKNYYDSTLFHRVIKGFMVQAGDPESRNASTTKQLGYGGPGYTIDAEINDKFIHKKGALAAVRFEDKDNPKRKSLGSQFYIVDGRIYPRKYLKRFEENRKTKYTEQQLISYETLGGSPHLDGQYTIFGEVIKGLDIIDKIALVKTANADRPINNIYIIKTTLLK